AVARAGGAGDLPLGRRRRPGVSARPDRQRVLIRLGRSGYVDGTRPGKEAGCLHLPEDGGRGRLRELDGGGDSMLLPEDEVRRCRMLVEGAFPRFTDWACMNERDEDYPGFCIWGRYRASPERMSPTFFVTFTSFREKWKGSLTVGKHGYYWSSAGVGDAHLIDTEACDTLEEAITSLKGRITGVFAALSGKTRD